MIRFVAMDLDGTLTQHKSKPDAECLEVLNMLSQRYQLLIVGAGGCDRIYQQLGAVKCDIIGFYGMQSAVAGGNKLNIIESAAVEIDRDLATQRVERLRSEFGYTKYAGETIEFHNSGLITFPILGTAARLDDKLAFDQDRVKRRAIYGKVAEIFNDYTVFVGGSSSFDIAPKPYCKSYALNKYIEQQGIDREQVIYFGDDYGLGGNDEDIYKSDIRFVCIDDYRDFPKRARGVLL